MRFECLEKRADVLRLDGFGQLDRSKLGLLSNMETARLGSQHAIKQVPRGHSIAYELLRQTDLKRSVETKQELGAP